ncbi:MAG: hypothetical protein C0410_03200 [Anaerolinea sp.]|nr:hypothetical protein [Anaerolinea sp.]
MDLSTDPIDGACIVTISEDGMSAWINLSSPRNGGAEVTLEQVNKALEENGVTVNINQLVVEQTIYLKLWDHPHLVATGTEPEEGKDGYIEYYFPTEVDLMPVVESEDGKVDFRNLNLIHNVKKGELLAERFPAEEGKTGQTITGKVIYPPKVINPSLIAGRDTAFDSSGVRLLAAKDGHACMAENKPTIISLYSVQHDVNFAVGNIDFVGNVQIKGDVKSGFSIRSGGDVEIFGMVEAAQVFAEGNILIKNGIFGAGKCHLYAGGNILAKYVENASLKALKDVIVNDSISRSHIKAGGKIKVNNYSGDIIGGHLEALEEITAGVFGSDLHITTELELGIEPKFRAEYVELLGKYGEKKKALMALEGYINEYKNYRENKKEISESYKRTMSERLRNYSHLRNEILDLEEKLKVFEDELAKLDHGTVKATKKVYPGVKVTIVKSNFVVESDLGQTMFIYDKGEVKPVPLRG